MQTFAPGAEELSLAVFTSESQREILATIAFEAQATLAFNESITLTLKGEVDLARLEAAFAKVVARHSIFRSNFSLDGKYLMVAKNPQVKIERYLDVSAEDIRRWEEEAAHYQFDLIRSPLIWACLGKIKGEARVDMLICAHHLVCDGWTWAILVQDLSHFNSNSRLKLCALIITFPFRSNLWGGP